MDEAIVVSPDTTELERATEDAERSAQAADQSAVAATSAALNQAAIIDIVTSAAREDSERSRQQAESSANEAERSAELATVVTESAILEIRSMIDDYGRRLSALETSRSEPVQVVGDNNVSPIDPEQTEQSERKEDVEGGNGTIDEKISKRKKHGRKSR